MKCLEAELRPEDEDEEDEECEEGGDVVHRAQHDDQLIAQRRQEPHDLEDAQQTERPQNGQTAGATLQQLHQTAFGAINQTITRSIIGIHGNKDGKFGNRPHRSRESSAKSQRQRPASRNAGRQRSHPQKVALSIGNLDHHHPTPGPLGLQKSTSQTVSPLVPPFLHSLRLCPTQRTENM